MIYMFNFFIISNENKLSGTKFYSVTYSKAKAGRNYRDFHIEIIAELKNIPFRNASEFFCGGSSPINDVYFITPLSI